MATWHKRLRTHRRLEVIVIWSLYTWQLFQINHCKKVWSKHFYLSLFLFAIDMTLFMLFFFIVSVSVRQFARTTEKRCNFPWLPVSSPRRPHFVIVEWYAIIHNFCACVFPSVVSYWLEMFLCHTDSFSVQSWGSSLHPETKITESRELWLRWRGGSIKLQWCKRLFLYRKPKHL